MAVFGTLPTNEPLGPKDYFLLTVPNIAIASGSVSSFLLGSIVMPFSGSLIADMYVRAILQAGNNYLRVRLVGSSPVPNVYSNHAWWPAVPGSNAQYRELAMSGQWNFVSKGTTVTFYASCEAGSLNQFTIVALGGFVHASQ